MEDGTRKVSGIYKRKGTMDKYNTTGERSEKSGIEHCNENPIYVFLFLELRDLSPNFHIHVSVSDLYIPWIGPHISCSRIGRSIVGIYKSLTDT